MSRAAFLKLLPVTLVIGAMVMVLVNTMVLSQSVNAYAASQQGAIDFANDWCGGGSGYGENAMADYMWITNPSTGGLSFNVVEGGDQTVPIKVNFYVTYCAAWPNDATAKGYDLSVSEPGQRDRLQAEPSEVNYGDRTQRARAVRETWGTAQYDAQLDLSGLATGDYWMCTSFASYSLYSVVTVKSDSACFSVHVNRTYPWATDGQSYVGVNHTPNVSAWDATPGQAVTWNHHIWNTTPYGTGQIKPAVERYGFRASSGLNGQQYPWSGAQFSLGGWGGYWLGSATANYNNNTYFRYVIDQDDVGAGFNGRSRICQFVSWGPWKQGTGAWSSTEAAPACVRVPYNFSLVPSVAGIGGAVEPGATIDVDPSVKNNGPTKSYDDTKWQLSRFIVDSTGTRPVSAQNNQAPCTYYGNGCQLATPGSSGQRSFPESPNNTPVGALTNYTVPDAELGSWLCFALSVQPYSQTSGDWYHGTPSCVKIGKKPKVQIQGHDAAVRGTIDTSTTTKGASTFGSWVEYGALSTGPNNRFASGAGLVSQSSSSQNAWSALTFANSAVPVSCGTHGCYASNANFRPLPGIAAYFGAMQKADYNPGVSLDANAVATGGPITVKRTGDLTLGAGSLSKGRTLVIEATGTVTITGDLTYANGAMASVMELPQLVIIARNINIQDSVRTVDAWLVTSDLVNGTVNTCSNGPAALTGGDCSELLTIHGPVVAGKLLLRRTAGSGAGGASGDPAEVISLRPDAFLWARLVAGGTGKAETVSTVELPPRF